jgi:hypothetical protein
MTSAFPSYPISPIKTLKRSGYRSGHRRQLLRAIAELKGAPEPSAAAAAHAVPHDIAERRQVTVMFSDLVGSTALSARMDPEDLREVISAYQKCVPGKYKGRRNGQHPRLLPAGAKVARWVCPPLGNRALARRT